MHDSFDELGLLEIRHGLIAALELFSGQAVALLQRRNGLIAGNRKHGTAHGETLGAQ
jgi:hypothetical protein